MYTCSQCGLSVIVLNGNVIRACRCKTDSRERTFFEKIKMYFGLSVEDISTPSKIIGNMSVNLKGKGNVKQS